MSNIYSSIALGALIIGSISTGFTEEASPDIYVSQSDTVTSVLFNDASRLSVPDKIQFLDDNGFTKNQADRYLECIGHRSMDGYEENGFFARRHIRFFESCLKLGG